MAKLKAGLRDVLHPLLDAVGRAWRRPVETMVPTMVAHRARNVPLIDARHAEDRCYDITPLRSARSPKRGEHGAMTWDAKLGRYRPEVSSQSYTQFSVDPVLAGSHVQMNQRTNGHAVDVIDAVTRWSPAAGASAVVIDAVDSKFTDGASTVPRDGLGEASLKDTSQDPQHFIDVHEALSHDNAEELQNVFSFDAPESLVTVDADSIGDDGFKLGLHID